MKNYFAVWLSCYLIILAGFGCAPKMAVVDKPLTELIQPETSPQKAASLRLTEEGRAYLQSGNLTKASEALEKAIAIDASNPYAYYYFASLRSKKGEHKQSLGLLAKAEILFKDNPFYLSNVYSLMGRNHESLFQYNDAKKRYEQALRLNSENTEAKEGMERLKN
ncbi:MAG: tetratricopeptide repeat protein [Nitrospirae bacterium]|nr:tetratricopeptide repeat protein [Nitrospirota bacterium]